MIGAGLSLRVGRRGSVAVVALTGTIIGIAFVLRLLSVGENDPTSFLALGSDSPVQTSYARRLLGRVEVRPGAGHDGKFFFAQANDPWYVDPTEHAAVLDRPLYRGGRMMYPMLAGGLGFFGPKTVVWSMIVVNVIWLGVGTWAASKLALGGGASRWLGLAVPLNVGLLFEVLIDGSGVVAFSACLVGLYAWTRGDIWMAAMWFAVGVLAREVMLAFVLGVLADRWLRHRRVEWRVLIVPVIALACWHVYLRFRLGGVIGAGNPSDVVSAPFMGLIEAVPSWMHEPDDLAVSLLVLAVVGAFVILALRHRDALASGALTFVPIAAVLGLSVWAEPFDLTRAFAPVFTASAFLVFRGDSEPPGPPEAIE